MSIRQAKVLLESCEAELDALDAAIYVSTDPVRKARRQKKRDELDLSMRELRRSIEEYESSGHFYGYDPVLDKASAEGE